MGTGSSTTIANHLRVWRAEQDGSLVLARNESLPQEMVTLMKGLWDRLQGIANEKVRAMEAKHQQVINELKETLEAQQSENHRWQRLASQWAQEKEELLADKLSLEQAITSLQVEIAAYKAELTTQNRQLEDKQVRVEELRRLHAQTQANLEHFRESTREQRQIDQQQFEQQKQALVYENTSLKEQQAKQQEAIYAIQTEYQTSQHDFKTLQSQHQETSSTLVASEERLALIERENQTLQEKCHQWEMRYQKSAEVADSKSNQLIDSQLESKVTSQQLLDTKQLLQEITKQNKLLAHDKWILAEEKAQLVGQMKQILKMAKSKDVA